MEANEILEQEFMATEKRTALLLAAAIIQAGCIVAHEHYSFDDCVQDAMELDRRVEKAFKGEL